MKIKIMKIKLKKNKPLRALANLGLGILNGIPVVSNFTPSVQDFNEEIDQVDLNKDGKIAKIDRKELIVYYILNNLAMLGTILLIIIGLYKGLEQDKIEWAVDLLNRNK